MSHVREHERKSRQNRCGANDDAAGMGTERSPEKQGFSPEAQACQSFLAHFKIPKEVGSKIQHESHASQTSSYFFLN